MTLELTGAISELREGFRRGAQAYVDHVNAGGGVAGRQVELIALDHSNKPDQAVANATRLISDDGAIAVTGMVLSSTCIAVERVTTEALQDAAFVLFMRILLSQGLEVPVVNYESGSSLTPLEGAGSANVYVGRALAYAGLAQGDGIDTYVEAVKAAGGDPDGPYVLNGYLAAMLVVEGLSGCGDSCTPQALRDALEAVRIDTGGLTSGTFGSSPSSHVPGGAIKIYRWEPETGEPVLEAEALEAARS